MNKNELVRFIAQTNEISLKDARRILDSALCHIEYALHDGVTVRLGGFGSFSVSTRSARKGRNPATGESVAVPASKTVRFKPSRALKACL